jgi:SAM-dependent methyltransferase
VTPRDRAQVFGEVAALYHRARPEYPDAALAAAVATAPGTRVVEVGAGTGKATVALAARGLHVVALEPDARMAARCRANTEVAGDRVEVRTTTLEAAALPPAAFDLAVAAQSWHWVDPDVGADRLAAALRPGGGLALLWNWPGPTDDPALPGIRAAYERWAPELADANIRTAAQVLEPGHFAPLLAGGRFEELEPFECSWVQRYTGTEYAELTQTHSPHRMLTPAARAGLAADLVRAIDAVGGTTDYPYLTTVRRFRRS